MDVFLCYHFFYLNIIKVPTDLVVTGMLELNENTYYEFELKLKSI